MLSHRAWGFLSHHRPASVLVPTYPVALTWGRPHFIRSTCLFQGLHSLAHSPHHLLFAQALTIAFRGGVFSLLRIRRPWVRPPFLAVLGYWPSTGILDPRRWWTSHRVSPSISVRSSGGRQVAAQLSRLRRVSQIPRYMALLAAPAATLILPPCCRFACIAELCCPPPALHPQPNNSPPPSSRLRPRRTQLDKIQALLSLSFITIITQHLRSYYRRRISHLETTRSTARLATPSTRPAAVIGRSPAHCITL